MKKIQIRNVIAPAIVVVALFVTLSTVSAQHRGGGGGGGGSRGGSVGGGGGSVSRGSYSSGGGSVSHYSAPSSSSRGVAPSSAGNRNVTGNRNVSRGTSPTNIGVGQGTGGRTGGNYGGRYGGNYAGGHAGGVYTTRGGYGVGYGFGYGYRGYGLGVFSPYGLYPFYPTLGLRIGWLPYGYYNFYWDGYPYYYYNSVFYRRTDDEQYEIVAPPIGAKVNSIPSDAQVVVINGNKYFESNGTYYQEEVDSNNQVSYLVVGTDGVLNQPSTPQTVYQPTVGDVVPQLPANCDAVYLNGQKYFESTDHVYYQEVIEEGKTAYKIVGK